MLGQIGALPRVSVRAGRSEIVLGTAAFAATAGLAAANGGFFPTSWGWSALALFWLSIVALIVKPVERLGPAETAFATAALGLAGWTWLSLAWSPVRTETVLEGERALVLVAGVATVIGVGGRRPVRPLLAGVLAAITAICAYGLATRLAPDRIGGYDRLSAYRLSTPVGYWNGLGVLAAMGVVLAFGTVARGGRTGARIAGGITLVVLLPALYFTFSRGAWIALVAGLAMMIALDPRRLQAVTVLLVCGVVPAAAVALASRSTSLTHRQTNLTRAAHDGHRLALVLLLLALLQALAVVALGVAQARFRFGRSARLAFGAVLLAAAALTVGAVLYRGGGPISIARHAYRSFTSPPPTQAADLNARLFNLSSNGRWTLWQAAWHEARAHPLLGDGAGAFGQYWVAHRTTTLQVADAHSLYLETLSELGPVGLALLLVLLGVPFLVAVKARHHPFVPAAAGGLAVYCVHASADWDWELAGATLAAVFVASACVLAPRERDGRNLGRARPSRRWAALACLTALSAVAFVGLIGNDAAHESETAAANGNWSSAASYAREAVRWAPWSSVGWQDLAVAQLGRGNLGPARRSLRKALAKAPRNWSLWLDLAAASRGEERVTALNHARELNPRAPDVQQVQAELAKR